MDRLNLLASHVRENPYPHYAELRKAAPVSQVDPGGLWAVSRYEDVLAILKEPELFSSQGLRAATIPPWIDHNPISESLVLMDPPRHTKNRALVTHAFGARVVPRVDALARGVARSFAARAQEGGEIDVCNALASMLPAAVIANLLGLDGALRERMRAWSEHLVMVTPATPAEMQPRILESIAELERYLVEVIADRRRERRDDLVSDLVDAEVDGQRLTEAELVSFLFLLLVAGYETTTHLLANALRILADRPQLIERLRADKEAIPSFIEEVLRFDPSVHGTMRLALRDTEVAGVRLEAGTPLLLLIGSASRDERYVEDPDRFDMDRKQRGSLAFGHGIHFCLGAALARAEARIALEELLPRIRGARVTEKPVWNASLTIRGPLECRMVFDAA